MEISLIKERIQHKLEEFKYKDPALSNVKAYRMLLGDILTGAIRVILAKIYFRSCKKIGRMLSANGKPFIQNKGIIELGDQVRIWSNIELTKIFVDKGGKLIVGNNTRIMGAHISVSSVMKIGNNVNIAPYVLIIDNDYHNVYDHFSDGKTYPIVIEDNAWIATRATILKGVTIGEGAVVAACSLVTKDVPPYTMVGGVPAKVIKSLKGAADSMYSKVTFGDVA